MFTIFNYHNITIRPPLWTSLSPDAEAPVFQGPYGPCPICPSLSQLEMKALVRNPNKEPNPICNLPWMDSSCILKFIHKPPNSILASQRVHSVLLQYITVLFWMAVAVSLVSFLINAHSSALFFLSDFDSSVWAHLDYFIFKEILYSVYSDLFAPANNMCKVMRQRLFRLSFPFPTHFKNALSFHMFSVDEC